MIFTQDKSLLFSSGDSDDQRLGDQVKMISLSEFEKQKWDWAIIGLPDDRGVALNGGRVGAAVAPNEIRKWFYRLISKCDAKIADLGNFEMTDDLHGDHDRATQAIAAALGKADKVAILGGGHDWGYSPIAALQQGGRVGFVNFDAHLDVRPSKIHHSGTSYWRALENGIKGEDASWIGVQSAAAAPAHVNFVRAHGGSIYWADVPNEHSMPFVACEYLDVSLDMDVFAMADAPGVSAPQPLGLRAHEALTLIRRALSQPQLRTFGIYETAPPLDSTEGQTSRLAARCLWEALVP